MSDQLAIANGSGSNAASIAAPLQTDELLLARAGAVGSDPRALANDLLALQRTDPDAAARLAPAIADRLSPSDAAAFWASAQTEAPLIAQASDVDAGRIDPFDRRNDVQIDVSAVEYELSLGGGVEEAGAEWNLIQSSSGDLKLAITGNINSPQGRNAIANILGLFSSNPVGGEALRQFAQPMDQIARQLYNADFKGSVELQVNLGQVGRNTVSEIKKVIAADDPSDDGLAEQIGDTILRSLPGDSVEDVAFSIGPKVSLPVPVFGGQLPGVTISQDVSAYGFLEGNWRADSGALDVDMSNGPMTSLAVEVSRGIGAETAIGDVGFSQAYTFRFGPGQGMTFDGEQIRDFGNALDRVRQDADIPMALDIPFADQIVGSLSDNLIAPIVMGTVNAAARLADPAVPASGQSTVYGIPREVDGRYFLDLGGEPNQPANNVFIDPDNSIRPFARSVDLDGTRASGDQGVSLAQFRDLYGAGDGNSLVQILQTQGDRSLSVELAPTEWQLVEVKDGNGNDAYAFFGGVVDSNGDLQGALWNGVAGSPPAIVRGDEFFRDFRVTGAFITTPPPGTSLRDHAIGLINGRMEAGQGEGWGNREFTSKEGLSAPRVTVSNPPVFNGATSPVDPPLPLNLM